jgi:hypothetical protein
MTVAEPVVDRNIVLNGLRFHYRDWGDQARRWYCCGFTGHARTWDHFAESVCGDFHVLASSGGTARPTGRRLPQAAGRDLGRS